VKIIREFENKYPKNIKAIYRKKNIGGSLNFKLIHSLAKGKYIANIDGDDYANPGKLQRQVEILENNSDCVICTHDMVIVNNYDILVRSSFKRFKSGKYSLSDLYANLPFFCNSSKMYVNDYEYNFPPSLTDSFIDIELHVHQVMKGKIFHIDECLGGYRAQTGVSSTTKSVNSTLINSTKKVFHKGFANSELNKKELRKNYSLAFLKYAYQSAILGDYKGLRENINESKIYGYSSFQHFIFTIISLIPFVLVFLCRFRAKIKGY
jgi:glycosyltransferase involved in cell wall biosynthesis